MWSLVGDGIPTRHVESGGDGIPTAVVGTTPASEAQRKVVEEARRGRGSLRGGPGRDRGRATLNKAFVECFKCHKSGHFQYECPDWEKGANYAELKEEVLLMAHVSFEEEENEIGGDGGASGEDGGALEAGKERGGCEDLSKDAVSTEVGVKFAGTCKEEEWLEAMECDYKLWRRMKHGIL